MLIASQLAFSESYRVGLTQSHPVSLELVKAESLPSDFNLFNHQHHYLRKEVPGQPDVLAQPFLSLEYSSANHLHCSSTELHGPVLSIKHHSHKTPLVTKPGVAAGLALSLSESSTERIQESLCYIRIIRV